MSINDLFKGLKSLEDLGRENYQFSREMKNGFIKFKSTIDESYIVAEKIKRAKKEKHIYNVLTRYYNDKELKS